MQCLRGCSVHERRLSAAIGEYTNPARSVQLHLRRHRLTCGFVPTATRQEAGPEAVAELVRALQLLNERAEQRAAYWRCTVCDEAFATGHEYRLAAPPLVSVRGLHVTMP